jgi:hypothetical protein
LQAVPQRQSAGALILNSRGARRADRQRATQQAETEGSYSGNVKDVGIATQRTPVVSRGARGSLLLEFRGLSDARSSVDRDTRLRIVVPAVRAIELWQLLGNQLTDEEKRAPVVIDSVLGSGERYIA